MENNNEEVLDVYKWSYGSVPLSKLKEWVDQCIAKQMDSVRMEIGWWPYADIDELNLIGYKSQHR